MHDNTSAFLTEQEILIRDTARKVAQEVVATTAAARDRSAAWPRQELQAVAELGFMGMHIPEAYGGSGLGFLEYCLALEEFAAADSGFATIVHVHNGMGDWVNRFGTEAQKSKYLPGIASGETIACGLLTEPQAGSDTANFRTTARREGDHFVLNGTKQFISNGSEAGFAFCLAITDKNAGKRGATLFILDPKSPGYKVARVEDKLGQRSAHVAQIVLEDHRVPAENVLGEVGGAYGRMLGGMSEGRIGIAAIAVGTARAALEAAVKYAKEREAYGAPIMQLQGVSFDLADMATQVDVARQYVLHAARLHAAGRPCAREASIAKLFAGQMAEQVCSSALQIHGGYGYLTDFPVERYYRDVRVTQIYEGTNHIQKVIIARTL